MLPRRPVLITRTEACDEAAAESQKGKPSDSLGRWCLVPVGDISFQQIFFFFAFFFSFVDIAGAWEARSTPMILVHTLMNGPKAYDGVERLLPARYLGVFHSQ